MKYIYVASFLSSLTMTRMRTRAKRRKMRSSSDKSINGLPTAISIWVITSRRLVSTRSWAKITIWISMLPSACSIWDSTKRPNS